MSALNTIDFYVEIASTFNPRSHRRRKDKVNGEDVEMTLVQTEAATGGTDGILHENVTCFGCNSVGHYCDKCLNAEQTELQILQYTHPEENMVLGDIIEELDDGAREEGYGGGGVLVEEPCGDEVFLADSDKDDVFVDFSLL